MEDNQIQKEIQSQNQLSNDEIISWGQLLSEAKDTLTKANVPDADIGFLWSTAFRLQRVSSF